MMRDKAPDRHNARGRSQETATMRLGERTIALALCFGRQRRRLETPTWWKILA